MGNLFLLSSGPALAQVAAETGISTGWVATLVGLAVATIGGGFKLLHWVLQRQVVAMDKVAESVALVPGQIAEAMSTATKATQDGFDRMHAQHLEERQEWRESLAVAAKSCRMDDEPRVAVAGG